MFFSKTFIVLFLIFIISSPSSANHWMQWWKPGKGPKRPNSSKLRPSSMDNYHVIPPSQRSSDFDKPLLPPGFPETNDNEIVDVLLEYLYNNKEEFQMEELQRK